MAIANQAAVETPEHLEKTLIISFEQDGDNGGEGMMLSIHQPYVRALKYRAQAMDFDVPGSFKQTSTCPVVRNGDSYGT